MKTIHKVAMVAALASFASVANAAVRLSAFNLLNFQSAAATVFIPLTSTGAVVATFNSNAAGRKVLTFSSECAVVAPAGDFDAWTDLDIIVNGAIVPPTAGTLDAFCSANGTAAIDGWETNSRTVVIPVRVGVNTVQIRSRLNAGATGHWYGERALVVHD